MCPKQVVPRLEVNAFWANEQKTNPANVQVLTSVPETVSDKSKSATVDLDF